MSLTTDPTDPRLRQSRDDGQNEAYIVLSEAERAKGFVRPVRRKYVHEYMFDGSDVPIVQTSTKGMGGCGALTVMAQEIAETYARDPHYYGETYCVGCKTHLPVGQFHWDYDSVTTTYQKVGS